MGSDGSGITAADLRNYTLTAKGQDGKFVLSFCVR